MSRLSNSEKTALKAKIVKYEALLTATEDELLVAIGKPDQYKFEAGDGSQMSKQRKLDELNKTIDFLEGKIGTFKKKLNCTGILTQRLSRYS